MSKLELKGRAGRLFRIYCQRCKTLVMVQLDERDARLYCGQCGDEIRFGK